MILLFIETQKAWKTGRMAQDREFFLNVTFRCLNPVPSTLATWYYHIQYFCDFWPWSFGLIRNLKKWDSQDVFFLPKEVFGWSPIRTKASKSFENCAATFSPASFDPRWHREFCHRKGKGSNASAGAIYFPLKFSLKSNSNQLASKALHQINDGTWGRRRDGIAQREHLHFSPSHPGFESTDSWVKKSKPKKHI